MDTAFSEPSAFGLRKLDAKHTEISFILPAANVEPYIETCLRSIAVGDIGSTEIILIDDASSDATLETASRSLKALKVEHQILSTGTAPQGPGVARNMGAHAAKGKYLAFIDSDDWIDVQAYRNLAVLCDRFQSDMGWLRMLCFSVNSGEIWRFSDSVFFDHLLAGREFRKTSRMESPAVLALEASCCNRVFNAAFYREQNISFRENGLYEDLAPHFKAILRAQSIVFSSQAGYYYRNDHGGQRTSRNDRGRFDSIEAIRAVLEDAREQIREPVAGAFITRYLTQFLRWCGTSLPFKERRAYFESASRVMQSIPVKWRQQFCQDRQFSDDDAFWVWLLSLGDADALIHHSGGKTIKKQHRLFCLETKRGDQPPPHGLARWGDRLARALSKKALV